MLHVSTVVFTGWIGMFALIMGMRISLVAIERPPYSKLVREPFEILHMIVAGMGGAWVCVRIGQTEIWLCATLLALWCSSLELVSLRFGWTTLERVHSFAGIVIAPASVVIGTLLMR